MGTWGAGSFDNDTAMDWTADITSIDSIFLPIKQFHEEKNTHSDDAGYCPNATLSEQIIAAVSTLVSLNCWANPQIPEDFFNRIAEFEPPTEEDCQRAYGAIAHVREHSELANLWAEDQQAYKEWRDTTRYLLVRINPAEDVDTENDAYAVPVEDFARPCVFCAKPVDNSDLYSIDLKKGLAEPSLVSMAFCHQDCFETALHPTFRSN